MRSSHLTWSCSYIFQRYFVPKWRTTPIPNGVFRNSFWRLYCACLHDFQMNSRSKRTTSKNKQERRMRTKHASSRNVVLSICYFELWIKVKIAYWSQEPRIFAVKESVTHTHTHKHIPTKPIYPTRMNKLRRFACCMHAFNEKWEEKTRTQTTLQTNSK